MINIKDDPLIIKFEELKINLDQVIVKSDHVVKFLD